VVIPVRVGEQGKLYGSVTSRDIAVRLEEMGEAVDRRHIQLDDPIREVGVYEVPLKLYADVVATIRVEVTVQESPEVPAQAG
jgi:large subunit ribosomal protein L9